MTLRADLAAALYLAHSRLLFCTWSFHGNLWHFLGKLHFALSYPELSPHEDRYGWPSVYDDLTIVSACCISPYVMRWSSFPGAVALSIFLFLACDVPMDDLICWPLVAHHLLVLESNPVSPGSVIYFLCVSWLIAFGTKWSLTESAFLEFIEFGWSIALANHTSSTPVKLVPRCLRNCSPTFSSTSVHFICRMAISSEGLAARHHFVHYVVIIVTQLAI